METVKIGKKEVQLVLVCRGPQSWSVLSGDKTKTLGHIWKRDPKLLTEEFVKFGLESAGEWAGTTASKPRYYNAGPRDSILRWLAMRV